MMSLHLAVNNIFSNLSKDPTTYHGKSDMTCRSGNALLHKTNKASFSGNKDKQKFKQC